MNNNYIGLIGYLFIIIGTCIDIVIEDTKKEKIYSIIQIIAYYLIAKELIHNLQSDDEEDENKNKIEFGHLILVLFYIYILIIKEEQFDITLFGLLAHLFLVKETEFVNIGFALSLIYYIKKTNFYYNATSLTYNIKWYGFLFLILFYSNETSKLLFI